MKLNSIIKALFVAIVSVCAAFLLPPTLAITLGVSAIIGAFAYGLCLRGNPFVSAGVVSNTIEQLIVGPGDQLARTTEAAFSKYGMATEGSAVGGVAVCGASDIPIGPAFVDGSDVAIASGDQVTVQRLAAGKPCLVIANEAITRGEAVYTAASGKVQDLPGSTATVYHIGYALTAAGADGDLILISPCGPIKTVIA